jgi:hypothetical protein
MLYSSGGGLFTMSPGASFRRVEYRNRRGLAVCTSGGGGGGGRGGGGFISGTGVASSGRR